MISQRDNGDFARFYTVTEPTKHSKGYTVYKVTARPPQEQLDYNLDSSSGFAQIISRNNTEDVQEITVWKRYSDFRKLHHNLWQLHKTVCSQSELFPPFAKAKVFGRFDDSVIEERRQCLEDLLQFSANIPALYSSQHIREFFKGGEVHDGSELIGPSEPFSQSLAGGSSDCSSDVQRDRSCAKDFTITSEYGGMFLLSTHFPGPSGDSSDLNSLAVGTESLAELDDGVALGRTSPKQPHGGAASSSRSSSSSPHLPSLHRLRRPPSPASLASKPEVPRAGRASLFSKKEKLKADYLDKASQLICVAAQKEKDQDYRAAFSFYRSGVDLLLQGVQGEPSPTRREAVKKKTAEYLMRAEQISSRHLCADMGQAPSQTLVVGAHCCASTSRGSQHSLSDDLAAYRVVGVIDKVLLVMDKRTGEMFVMKGLRKSSDCGRAKKSITPRSVPHMVQLKKLIDSEDTVFLLLGHAEGGKLWSHIGKYLHTCNPDDSFDIPFIQKSHTAAVHSPQSAAPRPAEDSSLPLAACASHSAAQANKPVGEPAASPRKSGLFARLRQKVAAHPDSGATSEEECTNSYLTLCNEYEQEKVEPDALEVDDATSEREVSFDVASGTASASSRSRSLLGNDSPPSSFGCPEPGDPVGPPPSSDGLPSLEGSKRTPMEFFRIDSKDSASEVTCQDYGERAQQQVQQQVQLPPSSHEEPPVVENLQELALEVKRHSAQLRGLDCGDKDSNESVPVISFEEAAAEDEAHRPDLLVNLPVVSEPADSQREPSETSAPRPGPEAAASPQRSSKPDVLQLPEEEEGQQAKPDPGVASSSLLTSLWDDYSLTFGQKQPERMPAEASNNHSLLDAVLGDKERQGGAVADVQPPRAREKSPHGRTQPAEVEFHQEVSRLFAELDELSLAASQARIPEAYVCRWAAELLTALDCLHREGIICRDLNPDNILLDRQGHVQLTYFCSWADVEESCDKEASANMYCAPEVGGTGEETAACDWWSLGAILFELLTSTSLLQCHPAGIGRHTALDIPESVSEEARSLLEQVRARRRLPPLPSLPLVCVCGSCCSTTPASGWAPEWPARTTSKRTPSLPKWTGASRCR
ncbi:ribosomal protein S6 kinase delta-1 isoform 2-T2 [Syngnathus typhle]